MHGTNRRSAEVSVDLANGNADTYAADLLDERKKVDG
jgi:hypothetical protein